MFDVRTAGADIPPQADEVGAEVEPGPAAALHQRGELLIGQVAREFA